ncbi:hypothetical protein N7G274_000861 [Stereocaulon virgatum]|uniref:PNPLA domain-containing protein n=1 Tax=Stereocaulon virgatum TaxID=373712 RepID=A0ABR4AM73_9LECA
MDPRTSLDSSHNGLEPTGEVSRLSGYPDLPEADPGHASCGETGFTGRTSLPWPPNSAMVGPDTQQPRELNRAKTTKTSPQQNQEQNRQSTWETQKSAPFEETEVWDEKMILSLDGGGIRGYSALLILRELMRAIGRLEKAYRDGPNGPLDPAESSYHPLSPDTRTITDPDLHDNQNAVEPVRLAASTKTETSPWLPCHYFDYVAGTSTGGLIGIMIGRLRMSIDDCISEYEQLGGKVFGRPRHVHLRSPLFFPRDKYASRRLRNVVSDVVKRRVPKESFFPGGTNFAFDENRCRTVVVAWQKQPPPGADKVYLFRSYKNLRKGADKKTRLFDRNPALAHDIPIWQVARATSAAPTYFRPMVIDGREYLDGGFGTNNPCEEIYAEVKKMNNHSKNCIATILSVGTGKNNENSRFVGTGLTRYLNYNNFARKWAADAEQPHGRMLEKAETESFNYFRLNVDEGLGPMKLDEWKATSRLRTRLEKVMGKLGSSKDANSTKTTEAGYVNRQQAQEQAESHVHTQNGTIAEGTASRGIPQTQEAQTEILPNSAYVDLDSGIEMSSLEATTPEDEPPLTNPPNNQDDTIHATNFPPQSREDNAAQGKSSKFQAYFQPRKTTLEKIRGYTKTYLETSDVQRDIEKCAGLLVKSRRARAKADPQRWEKACFGAWYQCNVMGCPRGEKEYDGRSALRKHLLDKHKELFPPPDDERIEAKLNSCKIIIH